mmetsp:Transcript_9357/g.25298  ORF Transcript_9357/g.25298 Transcript_9357/m.25298 type:complete len:234 (+) Transcript_9357:2751-3452(+)
MLPSTRANSTTASPHAIIDIFWQPYEVGSVPPPMSSSANLSTSGNGNSALSQYPQITGATCVVANSRVLRMISRSAGEHSASRSSPSALTAAGGKLTVADVAAWNASRGSAPRRCRAINPMRVACLGCTCASLAGPRSAAWPVASSLVRVFIPDIFFETGPKRCHGESNARGPGHDVHQVPAQGRLAPRAGGEGADLAMPRSRHRVRVLRRQSTPDPEGARGAVRRRVAAELL